MNIGGEQVARVTMPQPVQPDLAAQPLHELGNRVRQAARLHTVAVLLRYHQRVAARPAGESTWRALAKRGTCYKFCVNAALDVCNWLITAREPDQFCIACRHNHTIPNLSDPENLRRWRLIEMAKHRLFYTLLKLRLPLNGKNKEGNSLRFDFLDPDAAGGLPVMTGHANGLITLNVAEADDAERERARGKMGELYRTLLGHFRHEIAHYYWDRLIGGTPKLESFREIFGDERADYPQALQSYHANGAPADWRKHFISAYASSHPWEDFAKTWAHYFHMVDTLETANAFGLAVRPRLSKGMTARVDFDPLHAKLDRIIEAWLPLTFAVNSINRSMGGPDLYPFVLGPEMIGKLSFVHDCIREQAGRKSAPTGSMRAVVASPRQRAGFPTMG
jgi:hypothetical protein